MSRNMMALYQQRLDNFTQTVNYLHEIVGVDEGIALLEDEKMIKYKIDRVNQLVKQILNSEKQKIIMQLILKIQEIQTASGHQTDLTQLIYYKKKLQQKAQQFQLISHELFLLKKQREEQKKVYNQQKLQFQNYQEKYKEIQQKYEQYISNQQQKYKNNQREKIAELKQQTQRWQITSQQKQNQVQQLGKKLKQTQIKCAQLTQENKHSKTIIKQQSSETSKAKLIRIQNLKRQINRLNCELSEMKDVFGNFKLQFGTEVVTSFRSVKLNCNLLKDHIQKQFKQFAKYYQHLFQQKFKQLFLTKQNAPKTQDQLMKRMNNLQGQLNEFIQQQILH